MPWAAVAFYTRAEHASLPSHASGMLAVRIGQLTAKDFHLQDSQPCRLLQDYSHPLLLPGIKANTSPTNHYAIRQLQLQRFDGQKWVGFGQLLSE
jgi:hypothetical protein